MSYIPYANLRADSDMNQHTQAQTHSSAPTPHSNPESHSYSDAGHDSIQISDPESDHTADPYTDPATPPFSPPHGPLDRCADVSSHRSIEMCGYRVGKNGCAKLRVEESLRKYVVVAFLSCEFGSWWLCEFEKFWNLGEAWECCNFLRFVISEKM